MHNEFFQKALQLAESARYRTAPNPWVGCVIVKEGQIVGSGATQPPGNAHAETQALAQAGARAAGSTVYTTLEPCSHYGSTPPCAKALIEAGASHVVVGVLDPDPLVAGKGIAMLEEAKIKTTLLNCAKTAEQLAPYLHHRRTGRPYCRLKSAISIDGRIAAADGSSQWITCEEARKDVHRLRDRAQAVLVGSETALADQPALTVRHVPLQSPKQPLRVVLDRRGRISPSPNTLILDDDHLEDALQKLGQMGILEVLVEGGATIHQAFLDGGFADLLSVYVGPCIIGASGGPAFPGIISNSIDEASRWEMDHCLPLGHSVRIDYRPFRRDP